MLRVPTCWAPRGLLPVQGTRHESYTQTLKTKGVSLSGSGGSGAGQWPTEDVVDCAALVFEAVISSPQADAIAGLVLGELLTVALDEIGGVRLIGLRREDDDLLVGAVTMGNLPQLLRCLQQGAEFVAEVIARDGQVVRVRVRPRG